MSSGRSPIIEDDSYSRNGENIHITSSGRSPNFIAVQDGKPSLYTALFPLHMWDCCRTFKWMKFVWLSFLPELTTKNSHEIKNGCMAVLRILPRNMLDKFAAAKQEMQEVTMQW
ncbi:hypothetical protein RUND412_011141, partial [Rhizina undulata]